jgi:hypothetical protein
METLKLETNIPTEMALAFEKGRIVESQFGGQQVMYSLLNDYRIYLPLPVAHTIEQDLAIGRHTPFTITKRESGSGKEKKVRYEVARIEAMPQAPTPLAKELSPQAPATPATVPQSATNTPQNGHAVTKKDTSTTQPQLSSQTSQAAQPLRAYTDRAKRFMACFVDAFDVVVEVERYAARRSFTIDLSTADSVRALATTFYINDKGGAC